MALRHLIHFVVFTTYTVCTLALTVYALHHFVLLYWLLRSSQRRSTLLQTKSPDATTPTVTTHIPLYNEADVAQRVIDAVAAQDYPCDRHQILVLDDSTDDTRQIVDACVRRWLARSIDIAVVRRPTREGYKAGALAHAMPLTRGEFIAMFDSDFVPPRDFLSRAVPRLAACPNVGCLQGRWDHLNRGASWITRAQGLAIDGHFMVEQESRSSSGVFLNFNGTAGLWRREAIGDPRVGGWQHDTITEDLDLSYRAQMVGWKVLYDHSLVCPAEVPDSIPALRAQQRRWARGSMQTARKLLGPLWHAPIGLRRKFEGTFHLLAYTISIWMTGIAMLAWPFAHWFGPELARRNLWPLWILMYLAALVSPLVYLVAAARLGRFRAAIRDIPFLMTLGAGLCLDNSLAAFDGLFRRRRAVFERTPKSGAQANQRRATRYRIARTNVAWIELIAGFYTAATTIAALRDARYVMAFFISLYASGFLTVAISSLWPQPRPEPAVEPLVPAWAQE